MENDFEKQLQSVMDAHIASVMDDPNWAERPKRDGVNPNSATYWLPRITKEMPEWIPRSEIVAYDHGAAVNQMEGQAEYAEWPQILNRVDEAARSIGYPVFVRTDLASAKHDGPTSYLASSKSALPRVLSCTIEDNEIKFWTEGGPATFVIREFLKLDASFTAFNGLPVAREWRFFTTGSDIICAHPYWPHESIQFFDGSPEPQHWREMLSVLHQQPPEWEQLRSVAKRAAATCDIHPFWSVDFAHDVNGKWWLIDMAVGELSWHWPDCPTLEQ